MRAYAPINHAKAALYRFRRVIMRSGICTAWMASMGMTGLHAGSACGQDFPSKPLRIVTPGLGGGNDFVARLVSQSLAGSIGQPVIVDNRSSGVVPGEIVAKAPADGHTLLCYGSPFWLSPLMQKVPYDPVKDFVPITLAVRAPNILVVHPGVAARSVKDLIALSKARPGELNYAAGSTGAANHLAAELFKAMAGVRITRIPYTSFGRAVTDLLAGETQMMFVTVASVDHHVKSEKLRALAVTSAQPSLLTPGLTTVAAAGPPGFEAASFFGFFAPSATPAPVVTRLNREIVRSLNVSDAKDRFFTAGMEVVGSSPEQFAATVNSELAKMGKVIREAGIRLD